MQKTHHQSSLASRAGVPDELRTRILIVVDDHRAGRHLARMLIEKGYEGVRAVTRGARALVLAQQYSPGIVFVDVTLSDDAYQLARALRLQTRPNSLRLIALTSSIESSTRDQARDAGFERWLVMPIAGNELDNMLLN